MPPCPLAVSLSSCKAKSRLCCFLLGVRPQRHRRVDGRAVGGLQVGVSPRRGLLVRLGGGGRGVGALAGAAARLRAGTGFLHLPPLGERRLVDRLQAESFPFTFVKSLQFKKRTEVSQLQPADVEYFSVVVRSPLAIKCLHFVWDRF